MKALFESIKSKYATEIVTIENIGNAEISITINEKVNPEQFSQDLQNHLVSIIDELTILKVNIIDYKGVKRDSFATNQ